jgi:hypothetical protein
MTEEKIKYKEYIKNKEKWLIRGGFDTNIKKLNINNKIEIGNYVFMTPSKPVHNHQFRPIDKNKWVNKKEFQVRNSHDLLI